MENTLGIDASSSVVGYTILDKELQVIEIDYIKLRSGDSLIEKSLVVRDKFLELKNKANITYIGIEDILTKFVAGRSSIKTIITLAQANMLTQYQLFDVFGITPQKINVLRARNISGIKVPKKTDTKEFILNTVQNWYPVIDWPEKRTGGVKKECYDMADSLVVAKALVLENNEDGFNQRKISSS